MVEAIIMRRSLTALSLVLLLAGCDYATDPIGGSTISAARGGRLASRDLTLSGTTSETDTTTQPAGPQLLTFVPGAPPLRTYDTTFAAHQGWQQQFVILHEDANYFMVLDVPNSAQFVDASGTALPYGAAFGLRARVGPSTVSFEFEPHGSYFTGPKPVVLWVYLKYVDLGASTRLPSIWYQADGTDPWSKLPTTADRAGRWLKIELRHFSNYAVAF
jgi:hypothetical protein